MLLRHLLLIFFVLLGIVPIGITMVMNYNLVYTTLVGEIKNQLTNVAYQREIALEQVNELRIQQLKSLAAQNEVQEFVYGANKLNNTGSLDSKVLQTSPVLNQEIAKFRDETGGKNGFDNVTIINKSGRVIFATNVYILGRDLSHDRLFVTGLKESERYLTLENNTRRVQVVVPIHDSGNASNVIGVLAASTTPYFMDKILLNDEGLGQTGQSYLINSDKMLVTPTRFSDAIFRQKVDSPPVRACFEDGNNSSLSHYSWQSMNKNQQAVMGKGGIAYPNYKGIPVFGASFCENSLGYVLVVEKEQQEVLAPLGQLVIKYVVVGFVMSLSVVFLAIFLSNKMTKPLYKLKETAKKLADGNYNIPTEKFASNEIGELGRSMEKMKENIQFRILNLNSLVEQKTVALQESNRELVENQIKMNDYLKELLKIKTALDESSLVAITDKNGTITYANKKFCDISKYSKEELIGQNHRILKSGFHSTEFYQGMWHTISRGKIWRGEIKNRAKDGTLYWVKTTILPILGKNGSPIEYVSVRTDITEQKETSEKLVFALKELKEIHVQKDEFVAMVSHELRTPLIPILGYCEMALDHGFLNITDSQRLVISDMYKNAKRLKKMIDEILLAQKLELGKVKFEEKAIKLDSFMKNLPKSYQNMASAKDVEITIGDVEVETVKSDPDRLIEVFANLIDNALDFTPPRGKIEVGAKSSDSQVVFYVKDNGAGIPKDKQSNLFKKFYQVDTSLKRSHAGTGLGLSICKEIMEHLGGKIWVESEQGKGTSFFFTIPRN